MLVFSKLIYSVLSSFRIKLWLSAFLPTKFVCFCDIACVIYLINTIFQWAWYVRDKHCYNNIVHEALWFWKKSNWMCKVLWCIVRLTRMNSSDVATNFIGRYLVYIINLCCSVWLYATKEYLLKAWRSLLGLVTNWTKAELV